MSSFLFSFYQHFASHFFSAAITYSVLTVLPNPDFVFPHVFAVVDYGSLFLQISIYRLSKAQKNYTLEAIAHECTPNIAGHRMTKALIEYYCKLPEVQRLLSIIDESEDEDEKKEERGEFMYTLHGMVEKMKSSLLQHDTVTKTVSVFRNKAPITLTTDLFTHLFRDIHIVNEIHATVQRCLRKASPKGRLHLDAIQLTGGSSGIPLFQQALLEAFNAGFFFCFFLSSHIHTLLLYYSLFSPFVHTLFLFVRIGYSHNIITSTRSTPICWIWMWLVFCLCIKPKRNLASRFYCGV